MAKRWQQPWNKKSKTLPNASKRKEHIEGIISKYKTGIRTKVEQKTKPRFNQKYKDKLLEFGKETKKSRKRSERPKIYDEIVDNWDKTPATQRFISVYNLSKYYESEDVKDKIARRKDASGTYNAPTDSKYYTDYIRPYIAIKGYNATHDKSDRIEITDKMEELFQHASRNWLSNKISIEEFEQSFKAFEQGEELISDLYKGSKYKGTDVTEDDYKSMFYSIFRNMLQKSKSQYDSNTVRTYMLGNGIDEYVEGDGLTPDKLDEIAKAMGPKIDLVRGDIDQLSDLLEGNEPSKKHRKLVNIKGDYKVGDDDIWYDNDYMKYFKGYKLGDMTDEDIETISGILPTKKELLTAQKLLTRARQKANIDFKLDTVDLYSRTADVMEMYGSKLGIDELTNEVIDQIEGMNMLKYRGQWNN